MEITKQHCTNYTLSVLQGQSKNGGLKNLSDLLVNASYKANKEERPYSIVFNTSNNMFELYGMPKLLYRHQQEIEEMQNANIYFWIITVYPALNKRWLEINHLEG